MDHLHTQLLRLVEENDVKFIRLVFCDLFGVQKNVAILADRLAHALEQGVSFDASAIPGFADAAASDLFLQPDPETFSLLPWRPSQSGVGRLYCHILHPDGTPFAGDGRRLLREAQRHAEALGLRALLGPECEFYLFETDDRGRPTRTPFDEAGYFDMAPLDRGENVRRQICLTLEEMGVRPERSHHEQGPGQNEIDFRCAPPLRAIDDLMSMQTVVTAVAAQNGLAACFAPKPLPECSGSGLHLNFSLMDGAQNLFEQFPAQCDARAAAFLAGMLRRVPEICVFANPLPGSYRRLGRMEAPGHVGWSCQNRRALVRVPAASGADCRIELRSPDPACNPYYTAALLLEAGLEGIAENLPLPQPADGDLYTQAGAENLPRLPVSLTQAVELAERSAFLRAHLPEPLLDAYLRAKRCEAASGRPNGAD